MGDEAPKQELAAPETREGRVVSFTEDRALIQRAIRNGWIKSLERMDKLLDEAVEDVSAVIDSVEYAKLKVALARTAASAASVYTRALTGEQHTVNVNVEGDMNVATGMPGITYTVKAKDAHA